MPDRVLLVDDLETNRFLLREALEGLAVEVTEAVGGEEAIDAARRCAPDVVLLDLQMPGLNGFETARRLRQQPEGEQPYIVILSGHRDADEVEGFDECGADDFLSKPYTLGDVRQHTEQGLEIARKRRET